MKPLNLVTLIILIVGGLSWGLVGLFNWDWFVVVVRRGFDARPWRPHPRRRRRAWQLVPLFSAFESDPPHAFTGR